MQIANKYKLLVQLARADSLHKNTQEFMFVKEFIPGGSITIASCPIIQCMFFNPRFNGR